MRRNLDLPIAAINQKNQTNLTGDSCSDLASVEKFMEEAVIMMDLHHPHVLSLVGVTIAPNGEFFFSVPLVHR